MATFTNTNNEIFSQMSLEGFTKKLASFTRFAKNFSPAQGERGDQVLVPLVSALTATTFNDDYTVGGGAISVVTVNLTAHKIVSVDMKDVQRHANSVAELERFGMQMGKALGTLVMQDILSLVTTANFTSVTAVASTAFLEPQIRAVRLALNQADAPDERVMILDAVPYDTLLGVSNFVQAQNFYDSSVSREGRIFRAYGFDFVELNSLFASGASVMGFAAAPDAIALAMRYNAPQEGHKYNAAYPLTDPETGFVIGFRDHYDEASGRRFLNLEALYGRSVGISNGGRIVKRTD